MMRPSIVVGIIAAVVFAGLLTAAHEAGSGELRGRFESVDSTPFDPTRSCRDDVRVFSSLASGDFDFCREKLGYVPGKAECLRAVTTTCTDWVFDGASWLPRELVHARTERIACPAGPVPPSCPSGMPEPLN